VDDNPKNGPESGNVNLPLALTRQQAEVFELLRVLSTEREKFHEWYQGAILVLNSLSPDRFPQAAHSIRELCDKLPDRIADIPKFNSPVSPVKSLQRIFGKSRKAILLMAGKIGRLTVSLPTFSFVWMKYSDFSTSQRERNGLKWR